MLVSKQPRETDAERGFEMRSKHCLAREVTRCDYCRKCQTLAAARFQFLTSDAAQALVHWQP